MSENRTFAGTLLTEDFLNHRPTAIGPGNIKKMALTTKGIIVDVQGNPATLADGKIKENAKSLPVDFRGRSNVLEEASVKNYWIRRPESIHL